MAGWCPLGQGESGQLQHEGRMGGLAWKGMRDGERLGEETVIGLEGPGLEEGAREGWEVRTEKGSGILVLEPSRCQGLVAGTLVVKVV